MICGVYPATVIVEEMGSSVRVSFADVLKMRENSAGVQGRGQSHAPIPGPPILKIAGSLVIVVMVWTGIIVAATSSPKSVRSDSTSNSNSSSSATSNTRVAAASTSTLQRNVSQPPSRATVAQPDTMIYQSSSGQTYRVSSSDYYRLSSLKSALASKHSSVRAEEASLKLLAREVDLAKLSVNVYNQTSIDSYNLKVNQVNDMNARIQSLFDDYNRDIDSFNRELERVGTLSH